VAAKATKSAVTFRVTCPIQACYNVYYGDDDNYAALRVIL